jgi:hypothetical protein
MKTGDLEGMNYESLREMARRRLPKGIFEYIDRGCEDETALDHIRRRFDRIRMRPNVLVDLSSRTQEIELFGRKQALPLVVAPTAATGLVRHKGEIQLAGQPPRQIFLSARRRKRSRPSRRFHPRPRGTSGFSSISGRTAVSPIASSIGRERPASTRCW